MKFLPRHTHTNVCHGFPQCAGAADGCHIPTVFNVLQIPSTGRDGIPSFCRELSMIMVDLLMYTCMLDDQVDEVALRVSNFAHLCSSARLFSHGKCFHFTGTKRVRPSYSKFA